MYSGDVLLTGTLTGTTYSLVNPNQGATPGNTNNNMQNRYDLVSQPFTSGVPSFGNNNRNNSDPNTAGADGAYGLQSTWAFYDTTFGRDGIDGNGTRAKQKIHFGQNYENAFWSNGCFCMTYGDGANFFFSLVTLDIAGHEMTHGVISTEANLTYAGESGGLNESTADIFGTMVEFFANNAVDTPEYWVGEKAIRSNYPGGVYTQTSALRYMDDPHKDGNSPACWSLGIGALDVHYSSGPSNHMFYLLSNGGTSKCNGNVVAGIGNDKAQQIWYRALTDFMTQSTNYHQARTAALNAATAIYGAGSPERAATAVAFSAINVN
jgi:Zn-dependent metalloprotease